MFLAQHRGQDPVEALKKWKGRVALLHLKDKASDAPHLFAENVPRSVSGSRPRRSQFPGNSKGAQPQASGITLWNRIKHPAIRSIACGKASLSEDDLAAATRQSFFRAPGLRPGTKIDKSTASPSAYIRIARMQQIGNPPPCESASDLRVPHRRSKSITPSNSPLLRIKLLAADRISSPRSLYALDPPNGVSVHPILSRRAVRHRDRLPVCAIKSSALKAFGPVCRAPPEISLILRAA